MTDIRPFELRSFEEEAEAQAQVAKARDIVQAALVERDRIREEARGEGLEQGRAEGREAALQAERDRIAAETAPLRDLVRRAASALEENRARIIAAADRELVRLAIAVAEKVVKSEVQSGKKIAQDNVRRAIEILARRSEIRILLHPADLALVEAWLPELRRDFADLGQVTLEASGEAARGGCVIRTREGGVDADIQTQLREIERGLLG